MSRINSLHIILSLSCAVLFAFVNHGCKFTWPGDGGGGIQQADAGGMGTEGEPAGSGATPGAMTGEDAGAMTGQWTSRA